MKNENLLNEKIETERLLLIPISEKYIDEIYEEFTEDVSVFMYPQPTGKIEDTKNFINESRSGLKAGTNLQLVILNKETNEFLGCAGLHNLDKTLEFGIWLKKSAQGYKYGQEAMQAIKGWADENLNYNYILYPVAEDNIASKKIPEMLGGHIFRAYDDPNAKGVVHHTKEYRVYNLQMRKAKNRDFEVLYKILAECSSWLGKKGINQWQKLYPEDIFRKDIENGYVYVFEKRNGEIVGTVSLPSKRPFYYPDNIFMDDKKSWYVCRLAVNRDFKGAGFGEEMMRMVEEESNSNDVDVLRLDVVKENDFLEAYYAKGGFKKVGEDSIFDTPTVFMEKIIK